MCSYKETTIYTCSYQTRSQTRQASAATKTLLRALLKQDVRLWWKWRDVSIKSSRWNDGSRNETGKCQWKRVITYWHDFENEGNCINNKDLRLDNTSFLTKSEQTSLVNVFISDSYKINTILNTGWILKRNWNSNVVRETLKNIIHPTYIFRFDWTT